MDEFDPVLTAEMVGRAIVLASKPLESDPLMAFARGGAQTRELAAQALRRVFPALRAGRVATILALNPVNCAPPRINHKQMRYSTADLAGVVEALKPFCLSPVSEARASHPSSVPPEDAAAPAIAPAERPVAAVAHRRAATGDDSEPGLSGDAKLERRVRTMVRQGFTWAAIARVTQVKELPLRRAFDPAYATAPV